ncbi:hypothetical protein [Intrasporangium sp.]|uniref:hypothetical protein n=1 Tax=Intrasporangium sp. TaxID=1925024 RepID=UPI00293B2C35|nr:hypothetical protein [Intrasporangium sp.]MDV3222636.1 hypothetical protein [Intrasporangium sp.]
MGALHRTLRRAGTALAATAAITLAGSTMASAHHCYKAEWEQAAYDQLSSGKTAAWLALSDLGTAFLIGPEYAEQCGYVADDVVADWMEMTGTEQEPLIHMRAVIGGGAYWNAGKSPTAIKFLTDEDFGALTVGIINGMATCAPDWEMPPEE